MPPLIKNRPDLFAGLMFVVFGALAVAIARNYNLGSLARMGPAYLPIAVGTLLTVFGVAMMLRALRGQEHRIQHFAWMQGTLVIASVFVYAVTVRLLGLVLTTLLVVAIARLAGGYYKWRETTILGVLLAVLVSAIFILGLKLPLPLWPGSE